MTGSPRPRPERGPGRPPEPGRRKVGTRNTRAPVAEVDREDSAPGAAPSRWDAARRELARAPWFWLTTVRSGGTPHVVRVRAVWEGEALHLAVAGNRSEARHLGAAPHCVLTAVSGDGAEEYAVEGVAARVTGEAELARLVRAWERKYGPGCGLVADGGALRSTGSGEEVPAFRVTPVLAHGFRACGPVRTRWRFPG